MGTVCGTVCGVAFPTLLTLSALFAVEGLPAPDRYPPLPEGDGLAAKYPGDGGIEKEPAVVFADGFEDIEGDAIATDARPQKGMRWDVAWHTVRIARESANVHGGKQAVEIRHEEPMMSHGTGKVHTQGVGLGRLRAEQLRSAKEVQINRASDDPIRIRLSRFAQEHLDLMVGQLAPATVNDQRVTLRDLRKFTGDVYLDEIRPHDAERYFATCLRSVRPATANKRLRTLKGVLAHSVRRGYLDSNPFGEIKAVREAKREHRVLTMDEIRRLVDACPDAAWRAFVFLGLSTGMRRGELTALEWADVDLAAGVVMVRNKAFHPTKSRKTRMLALVPVAVEFLSVLSNDHRVGFVFQTRQGRPMRNNLNRQFGRIVAKAGIPHCTLHDLRRTFCSHLAMDGVNEAIVQKLAGHASITTTLDHYTRIFPEVLRSAQMRLAYATRDGVTPNSPREPKQAGDKETAQVVTASCAVS
jgi:integrase